MYDWKRQLLFSDYLCISVTFFLNSCINVLNSCTTKQENYYVFFNMLKFENTYCMSKYEYKYDGNVELSIYYPTSQNLCLIILWTS